MGPLGFSIILVQELWWSALGNIVLSHRCVEACIQLCFYSSYNIAVMSLTKTCFPSSCLFLAAALVVLCCGRDISCNVTEDAHGTLYTVPDFQATRCIYSWTNSTVGSTCQSFFTTFTCATGILPLLKRHNIKHADVGHYRHNRKRKEATNVINI